MKFELIYRFMWFGVGMTMVDLKGLYDEGCDGLWSLKFTGANGILDLTSSL